MAVNKAAWLQSAKAWPFEIASVPMGKPEENQVLVMNHAIAINPVDGKIQRKAFFPLQYPTILGQDVAGEIVAIGSGVTRFTQGQRVIGLASGFESKNNGSKAFQHFTILDVDLTCEIPDAISYERAVVIPLGLATAASALFNPEMLNLDLPISKVPDSTSKTLIIWGGSSSVGSNAIQLAAASGYEVITTASEHNFDYVKKLGASHVFDYKDANVVSDIVGLVGGKNVVGAFDAIGDGAWKQPIEILQRIDGVKIVVTVTPGWPQESSDVLIKQTYSLSIKRNQVAKAIFETFLPPALNRGTFTPAPEPLIAGKGLEKLQTAIDLQNEGTSARKIVVTL